MRSALFSLVLLLAIAGLLPSCGKTETKQPDAQAIVQDSLAVIERPEPLVIFLDLGGGMKDCHAEVEAIEARLHGHLAWQTGLGFETIAEDSAALPPPGELAFKFYSIRKVAELRIRDAIKLKLKTTSHGQLKMQLYRNEGHTWSKYHESPFMPCAAADTLILEMLKLLTPNP